MAGDRDYLESLEKLRRLDVNILVMAHLNILTGDEVQDHLSRSVQATRDFRRRIEEELAAANGNLQAVVEKISREAEQTSLGDPILQTQGVAGFELLNDALGHISGVLAVS